MAASTYNPLLDRQHQLTTSPRNFQSDSTRAASPISNLGYSLTLLYIVLLVGRVPEITTFYIGSSLYQVMLLTVAMLPLVIMTGSIVTVGSTRVGLFWFAFHLWVLFTLPFSGYRAGSLEGFLNTMKYYPAVFFVGGFLSRDIASLTKGIWALAWAAAIGLTWLLKTGAADEQDGRFASTGAFGNSNLLAIYLLMMMPFWGFIAVNSKYKWFVRLFFASLIGVALNAILKTGSRSGMMTVVIFGLVLFLGLGIANKFKFIVVAAVVTVVALTSMPDTLKARLATVFTAEAKDKDDAAAGAIGSSEARYALLIESLQSTWKHPLFGTGFGVYMEVAAQEREKLGKKGLWQVSHNAYTQVSAETGIIGFVLYIGSLYFAIREVWRVKRMTRGDPRLKELNLIATCLLFSLLAFCFNACFTSMATDFTIYTLLGFCIACSLIAQQVRRQQAALSRADGPMPGAQSPVGASLRRPFQKLALPVSEPAASTDATPAAKPNSDAPWRRNPRKYPPPAGSPAR